MTLSELIDRVEKYFHTEPGQLDRRSRDPIHQNARDIFCAIAVKSLGHSGTQAGRILNIRRSAVSHAVRRGHLLLAEMASLKDEIIGKTAG
jgi:chromosomal replication initiation ATPase DnaA